MVDEYAEQYIQKLSYMTGIPSMALGVIMTKHNIQIPLNRSGRAKLSAHIYRIYKIRMKIPAIVF